MQLLVTVLAVLSILSGIALFFAPGKGSFMASIVCIGSGVFAFDQESLIPLAAGFGILWILKLLGFENRA